MSETQKFHPQIEKALETSGEDIGRVKDDVLAAEIADMENTARDTNKKLGLQVSEERYREQTNKLIRHAIARRAVDSAANMFLHNTTVSGIEGSAMWDNPEQLAENLKREASIVAEDYDAVERAAQEAKHSVTQ